MLRPVVGNAFGWRQAHVRLAALLGWAPLFLVSQSKAPALFLLGVTQVEELIKTTRVCVWGGSQIRTELECSSLELGLYVPSACHRAVAMARCWLVVLAVSPLLAALSTEGGEGEAFRGLGRSALGLESCPAGSFAASPGNVELLGSSSALLPGHTLPSCCWG